MEKEECIEDKRCAEEEEDIGEEEDTWEEEDIDLPVYEDYDSGILWELGPGRLTGTLEVTPADIGRMLIDLGAFFGDIGIMLCPKEAAEEELTPEEKLEEDYDAAKKKASAQLISILNDYQNEVPADANETINDVATGLAGLSGPYGVGMAIGELESIKPPKGGEEEDWWKDMLAVLYRCFLIIVKRNWPLDNAKRKRNKYKWEVRVKGKSAWICLTRGGTVVKKIGEKPGDEVKDTKPYKKFPNVPEKVRDAEELAEALNKAFDKCEFPTEKHGEDLRDLLKN